MKRLAWVLVWFIGSLGVLCAVVEASPPRQVVAPGDCEAPDAASIYTWCKPEALPAPDGELPPDTRGTTGLPNPAVGNYITGTADDPLAEFSRRPFDNHIIPEGGLYLDATRDGEPHYGVDYACPSDYLNGVDTYLYPIGPGYVTAHTMCVMCYVNGDPQGRVETKWPYDNFGWGNVVLIETPYNEHVSIYVLYAHLERDLVSLGRYVTPQDAIGVVGTSGYSQEYHVHVEIRYGAPGRFWSADFGEWATLDRWLATMFVNPAWLVIPESHLAMQTALEEWAALQQGIDPSS
ncbi:MAG: M23 family metallopeptidase [Anaerolineae bacterium]|nr:M23 family metallopeptidase [Anaerolineae bacterium]